MGDEPPFSLAQVVQDQDEIVTSMIVLLNECSEMIKALGRLELAAEADTASEPSEGSVEPVPAVAATPQAPARQSQPPRRAPGTESAMMRTHARRAD